MSKDLLTLPQPNSRAAVEEDRCARWRLMLHSTQQRTTQNQHRRCQNAIALLDETVSAMIENLPTPCSKV
ncbi:hypothetical protein [Nostoc sp. FACHB-110]|uniref:hypothetical protein n=1 Tax=Nostoc sp. FACHB-110 TaxID=2692834 RepID=UPI0016832915|nr:hypothetical protein [Nostoc sp. FACHB-110]MBD2438661.1 hypothetical protein [Nostoc sp. FACHB-110]